MKHLLNLYASIDLSFSIYVFLCRLKAHFEVNPRDLGDALTYFVYFDCPASLTSLLVQVLSFEFVLEQIF
jgi:hypothetical protein